MSKVKQNSLSKNIFQTFGAKVIAFVFAFGASAFITRLLGPSGKGIQIFINTNVSLFTIILGLNINAFLLYFSAREEEIRRKAMGFSLVCLVALFGSFMVLFWSLKGLDAKLLGFIIPDKYLEGIYPYYFSVFLFISMGGLIIQGFWKGSKFFKYVNFMVIFAACLKLIAYGIAFFSKKYGIIEMKLEQIFVLLLGVMILTFLTRLGLFLFKSNLKIDFSFRPNMNEFLGFLNFGYLAALMNFANKRVDIWFIEHYNTIQELGFYGLAAQLSNLFITILLPATFVISPYLTNATQNQKENIISRFSRFISSFGLMFIVLVFMFAWFVIPLVFGEEFTESVTPTKILIIAAMFMLFKNTFSVYNYSQNNVKPNFIGNLIAVIITIILDYFWIPTMGIMGAAYASLVAYFSSSMFIFYGVYKKFSLNLFDYFLVNKSDLVFVTKKVKVYLNK